MLPCRDAKNTTAPGGTSLVTTAWAPTTAPGAYGYATQNDRTETDEAVVPDDHGPTSADGRVVGRVMICGADVDGLSEGGPRADCYRVHGMQVHPRSKRHAVPDVDRSSAVLTSKPRVSRDHATPSDSNAVGPMNDLGAIQHRGSSKRLESCWIDSAGEQGRQAPPPPRCGFGRARQLGGQREFEASTDDGRSACSLRSRQRASHRLRGMPTRVLIVSPAFHGIWRSVASALEQRGFEAKCHLYDENVGVLAKSRHHLTVELPSRLGLSTDARLAQRLGEAARNAVQSARPDAVLTVKGDLLGDQYWDSLARIPHATWLYDQLDAMKFTPDRWSTLGGIGSFSHSDTARLSDSGVNAAYVALAYDPAFEPSSYRTGGIVFAGARYPPREHLLLAVQAAGVPVRAYGRSWSKHPYDRVRTWDLHRPAIPSARELTRRDAHQVMQAADATINIHGAQDGFTLRTFEASGIGALHLIDRPDVVQFYEPGARGACVPRSGGSCRTVSARVA